MKHFVMSSLMSLVLLFSLSVSADQAKSVAVEITQVQFNDYAKSLRISGLLENKSEQSLGFKIPGLVSKVLVDEGEYVTKGQLLAVLDLEEIDAEVAKATSVLANAELNLARFTSLQGQNALSLDQLQAAQTRMDVAKSDLTVAQFNRRYAVIKAPESGRILNRFVEPNEWLNAGQSVFVFAAKQTGWVLTTGITDKDIVRTQLGDQAELYFDAYPQQKFIAQVSQVAARADAATQTFAIELRLAPSEQALLAGFVGHGRVYPSQKERLALLPLTALVRAEGKQAEVYVLDENNLARLRTVDVAFIEGRNMAVRSGLNEGDRLVIQGAPYLSEARSVSITQ